MKSLIAFSLAALLLPMAASAQLALFTFDGTTETPVGLTYDFGSAPAGSNKDVRFRVFNTSTSPVTISKLSVSGAGFSFSAINGSAPYVVPPVPSSLNFLEFTVRFNATIAASYSANLQVNSVSVLLLGAALPAAAVPVVAVVSGCTNPAQGVVDVSAVQMGGTGTCNFVVQNPGAQPLPISVVVTGSAFQGPNGTQTPLNPSEIRSFTITFTPVCGTALYSGSLVVNGQSFALSASGITPQLATPLLTFDAGMFASQQQRTLTLNLPTAAPCGATGNLNLAFAPTVPGVAGDGSVMFMQGSTPGMVLNLPFSIAPNSTVVSINKQPSATFQTGTTAGTITFTLTGALLTGYQMTTITIPPATITIETATASNQRLGELDVEVIGFDNTYSAGMMSFTFFDTVGKQVGSAVTADFTPQFKSYFAGQNSGSAFLMRVSFPVTGDQTQIGTVKATLTNSAGPVQSGALTFQ